MREKKKRARVALRRLWLSLCDGRYYEYAALGARGLNELSQGCFLWWNSLGRIREQ